MTLQCRFPKREKVTLTTVEKFEFSVFILSVIVKAFRILIFFITKLATVQPITGFDIEKAVINKIQSETN